MSRTLRYVFLMLFAVLLFAYGKAQGTDTLPAIMVPDTIYENGTVSPDDTYQFKETAPGSVATRKVSDADLHKLKSDKDYWYVNEAPPREKREVTPPDVNQKGKKMKSSSGIFASPWLNVLLWIILIGGFIALLVWFLSTSDIRLFRRKPKTVEETEEEEASEDIFEMDFEKAIQKSIDAGNFRMAVRLLYLRTLRDLSNNNLINYTHEKTNSDYLFQLAGSPHYKNFFRLTRSFDYTWYGQFALSQDSFTIIHNDFSSFKQQLSS